MRIKIIELKVLVEKALKNYGYDLKEITIISEILLYAQLRGNNQGIVKLIGKGIPKNPEAGEITVDKETKLSTLFNGNQNMGMVVLKKAVETALEKAKEYGFGIAGTRNTSSSTGAIGYYANEIAKHGFLGFVFAGSPESVAVYGSYEPIFGTNPLAIGIPSENEPVVLDMATAAMAYFGLVEAKTAGRNIAEDVAYDKNGNPTTNPTEAMDGALRTFDRNYKGSGLCMMIEILTGPLVEATFSGIGDRSNWGNLVFIIDPDLLTDSAEFKKNISALVQKVKLTKKLPRINEIFVPGEKGNNIAKERIETGEIEVEDNLLNGVRVAAGE